MDLLREELRFGMDHMMTIEEVMRNSEPNSVVYLSANEARALEEPDKIRARMERQMQEGQASINTGNEGREIRR